MSSGGVEVAAAKMRTIRKCSFLSPLLRDADFIAPGFKPRDSTRIPGWPPGRARIEIHLTGPCEPGVKMVYVTGPANNGYRTWYSVIGARETPPVNSSDFRELFYTRVVQKLQFLNNNRLKMAKCRAFCRTCSRTNRVLEQVY
jgi:hypothetical protein